MAGGVAENACGFIDVSVEYQCVAEPHLAAPITARKSAIESISGDDGSVHSVPGFI